MIRFQFTKLGYHKLTENANYFLYLQALKMYSKKALKYMRSTIENIKFWRSACLWWNPITNEVEMQTSIIDRALWLLNFLLHVAHVAFLLVRYIQFNYIDKSAKASVKVYTEYALVAYSIPLTFHVCIYSRLYDLVGFLNEYSKFYGSVGGKFSLLSANLSLRANVTNYDNE